jgi:hypothetical protein
MSFSISAPAFGSAGARGSERGANALSHFVTADAEEHAAVIRNLETRDGGDDEARISTCGRGRA